MKRRGPRADINDMLLSIDQVAERAGVHPSTLRRWLKAGGHLPKPLPVKAIGGGPLWRECDVERWREEKIQGGELFDTWPKAETATSSVRYVADGSRLRLVQ